MKTMNYLLLAIMTVFFSAPDALAGVVYFKADGLSKKDSIFAHTGQDPVHRNFEGDQLSEIPPIGWWIPVSRDPSLDLVDAIIQDTLGEDHWLAVHSISIDQETIVRSGNSEWNNLQNPSLGMSSVMPLGGSGIPSPSAFLVLISGLALCKRRKQ